MNQSENEIGLIKGGVSVDDRGEVRFCNDFYMNSIKRFYQVSNYQNNFVRAWHAHKNESKYVYVVTGAAVVAAVKIDNWKKPSKDLKINRYVVSDKSPSILYIPKGFANGFMTLKEDTNLIFFSTSTLEESKNDDFRYEAYYWNPWEILKR